MEIISCLPVAKRGLKTIASLCEIINSILYKLKNRVQSHLLPVKGLFSEKVLNDETIFGQYRDWCRQDIWKSCWIQVITKYKSCLDLSSNDFDGSHTRVLRGGEKLCIRDAKSLKPSMYFI